MRKMLIFLLLLSAVFLVLAVLIADKNRMKIENKPLVKKNPSASADATPAAPGQALTTVAPVPSSSRDKGTSSLDEHCDLSSYGMDCAITKYLEENLAWTAAGGVDFCSYEKFPAASGGKVFMDAACQEFFTSNGKIYIGSGIQTPAAVANGNGVTELWTPRDGNYNSGDVRAFFPPDIASLALEFEGYERLGKINIERAQKYFALPIDYKVVETSETDCSSSLDCATPGKYLMMSSCQFTSSCLRGKCSVICPNYYAPENTINDK